MELVLILIGVLVVISIPLVLLYFISQYNWRLKKLTPADHAKSKRADLNSWRLFGFLLIGASVGASFGVFSNISPDIASLPFYWKAGVFLFGITLVAAASYEERK